MTMDGVDTPYTPMIQLYECPAVKTASTGRRTGVSGRIIDGRESYLIEAGVPNPTAPR
jgi:hypothetical protein